MQKTLNTCHIHLGQFVQDMFDSFSGSSPIEVQSFSTIDQLGLLFSAEDLAGSNCLERLHRLYPITDDHGILDRIAASWLQLQQPDSGSNNERSLDQFFQSIEDPIQRDTLQLSLDYYCLCSIFPILVESIDWAAPVGTWTLSLSYRADKPFAIGRRMERHIAMALLVHQLWLSTHHDSGLLFVLALAQWAKDNGHFVRMVSQYLEIEQSEAWQVHLLSQELGLSSLTELMHFWTKWIQ